MVNFSITKVKKKRPIFETFNNLFKDRLFLSGPTETILIVLLLFFRIQCILLIHWLVFIVSRHQLNLVSNL
jgi:hypothetical protein